MDLVHDALDSLWQQETVPPYPQERMARLFDVISDTLLSLVQHHLELNQVFQMPSHQVRT